MVGHIHLNTSIYTFFLLREIIKSLFSLLFKVIVCTSIKEIINLKTNSKAIIFLAPFTFPNTFS
jgi:hypothetical protein